MHNIKYIELTNTVHTYLYSICIMRAYKLCVCFTCALCTGRHIDGIYMCTIASERQRELAKSWTAVAMALLRATLVAVTPTHIQILCMYFTYM